jgi:hypothetical protein
MIRKLIIALIVLSSAVSGQAESLPGKLAYWSFDHLAGD